MLAVANYTPWATLSALFGGDIEIITKSHGDIGMNASLWARSYVL